MALFDAFKLRDRIDWLESERENQRDGKALCGLVVLPGVFGGQVLSVAKVGIPQFM